MKKGGVIFLLTVITAALVVLNGYVYVKADHTGPVIHVPESNSEYAKNVDAKTLLDGVTATDNRDGDVSSTLRVATIVPNSDNTKASIVYTAKDKSNNVTKLTRTITYSTENSTTTDENAATANPAAPASHDSTAAITPENVGEQSTSAAITDSVPTTEANSSANNE